MPRLRQPFRTPIGRSTGSTALLDNRLGDFLRPPLWRSDGARQLFMTSLLTGLIGEGPAATITHLVPDLHHFRGSFGGKDVIPLWRDAGASRPNLNPSLIAAFEGAFQLSPTPEDVFAYVYALLSAPSYTERFAAELEIPGPRVPLTSHRGRFEQATALGRELIWLHTFGERLVPPGERAGRVPQGMARSVRGIPARADAYPERHAYDPTRLQLHVGDGIVEPVSPEVRFFSVSGLGVVGSWLDYRMKAGAGRRSSELDEIRPDVWPASFTEELLELLWILERTVALGPALDAILDEIVGGDVISASDLSAPTDEERRAPTD